MEADRVRSAGGKSGFQALYRRARRQARLDKLRTHLLLDHAAGS